MTNDNDKYLFKTNILSLEDLTKHLAGLDCVQVTFTHNTIGLDFEDYTLRLMILTREVTAPPAAPETTDAIIETSVSKFFHATEEDENTIRLTFEAGFLLVTKVDLEGDTLNLWQKNHTYESNLLGCV